MQSSENDEAKLQCVHGAQRDTKRRASSATAVAAVAAAEAATEAEGAAAGAARAARAAQAGAVISPESRWICLFVKHKKNVS